MLALTSAVIGAIWTIASNQQEPKDNHLCQILYDYQGIWNLYAKNPESGKLKLLETYRSHQNAIDNAANWGCKEVE